MQGPRSSVRAARWARWLRTLATASVIGMVVVAGSRSTAQPDPVWPTEVPEGPVAIQAARSALYEALWGEPTFKDVPYVEGLEGPADQTTPESVRAVAASSRSIFVSLRFGMASQGVLLKPAAPARNCALIYSGGHGDAWLGNGDQAVAEGLKGGCEVAVLDMPLHGRNALQRAVLPDGRKIDLSRGVLHDEFRALDGYGPPALDVFVDPIVAAASALLKQSPSRRVMLAGLSGGAWLATLAAAVDPRITQSLAVGGPLVQAEPINCTDDYEQCHPEFHAKISPIQLVTLASSGPLRVHAQQFSAKDPCCHQLSSTPWWAEQVQSAAAANGGYYWPIITTSTQHAIDETSLEIIRKWVTQP